MSVLYHFRIIETGKMKPTAQEIAAHCFDAMEDNFRSELKPYGIDISGEPNKIKADRFVELMEQMVRREGIKEYAPLLRTPYVTEEDLQALRDAAARGDLSNPPSYRTLLKNNLYARLLDREADAAEVLKLRIQVVSIHPDAGFPRFRFNAAATKGDERRFLIRLLAGVREEGRSNPLEDWFAARGTSANEMKGIVDPALLLWGFLREKKSLKLRPESPAFWKKHSGEWWADLEESLTEKSDNKPYELVNYELMLPSSLFAEPGALTGLRFESAAHWMR